MPRLAEGTRDRPLRTASSLSSIKRYRAILRPPPFTSNPLNGNELSHRNQVSDARIVKPFAAVCMQLWSRNAAPYRPKLVFSPQSHPSASLRAGSDTEKPNGLAKPLP